MKFLDWLDGVNKKYDVNLERQSGENHFVKEKIKFSDAAGNGIPFTISLNDEGDPSVIEFDYFDIKWFNIAEGASSEDICNAANQCLEGTIDIKKGILNHFKLEFNLVNFSTAGKLKSVSQSNNQDDLVNNFRLGYKRK